MINFKNFKKEKILVLFIFLILFIFSNLFFVSSLIQDNLNKNVSLNFNLDNSYKCINLNKHNPYLKSYTYLINELGTEIQNTRVWDSCVNLSFLNESSCNIHGNQIFDIIYCPDGCEEGICMPKNKDKSKLKPKTSYSCDDTDLGISPFFNGSVILTNTTTIYTHSDFEYQEFQDTCVDKNTLIEYYCDSLTSSKIKKEKIKCPEGCEGGECIIPDNFIDFSVTNLSFTKMKDINSQQDLYSLSYCLSFNSKDNSFSYSDLLQKIVEVEVYIFTSTYKKNNTQIFWGFSPSIYFSAKTNEITGGEITSREDTFYVNYNQDYFSGLKSLYQGNYSISPNDFCISFLGNKKAFFNNNLNTFYYPNSLLEDSIVLDLSDTEINTLKVVIDPNNQIKEYNEKNNFKEIIFDPKKDATSFISLNLSNSSKLNSKDTCNGCLLNSICYPIGFRNENSYCSGKNLSFNLLLNKDSFCNNNFECKSNLCLNSKCKENASFFNKLVSFFKNIF